MEGHQRILLALIFASFTIRHLVQAQQDQQGFISLDCGLPTKDSPYTDPITNLTFSTDADYIQSGNSSKVAEDWLSGDKRYNVLRYFPESDGKRNCYTLIVKQGTDYLIRAGFSYGNYDGKNKDPKFDMFIGPNLWSTVESTYEDNYEIIHKPKSNSLQICLVKTGETTPMISTLELRPLKDGLYITQSGSLRLTERSFYNTEYSTPSLRYPDDVYDRIWSVYTPSTDEKVINATLTVNSSNPFEPPQDVFRTALTPKNANRPLSIYVYGGNPDKVSTYLYFAEIQVLQPNDTREFDMLLGGDILSAAYSPKTSQVDTIYNELSMQGSVVELVKTKRSTLPPLVNGIENYEVMEFPYSETNPNDVAALKNIQTTYALKISSWQGDPCLPELWKWKGVECSHTNMSIAPRIISLDLSSKKLRGNIAPSLQNLTELQKLDLSSNSLSGEVPEFLANMKSLLNINLNWNNLKGKIPQALRDREKNNGLKLSTQENPKLCRDDKCKTRNTSFLVPAVASTASLFVIVANSIKECLVYENSRKEGKSDMDSKSSIERSTSSTPEVTPEAR